MWENLGGDPHNKDYSIWGPTSRSLYLWKPLEDRLSSGRQQAYALASTAVGCSVGFGSLAWALPRLDSILGAISYLRYSYHPNVTEGGRQYPKLSIG